GKGIVAMDVRERDGTIRKKTGKLIASFPVEDGDQLMLVTDGGQLIRTRVEGIRIAGRSTQGVIVFDTAEGERVVSVERISEEGAEKGGWGGTVPPRGRAVIAGADAPSPVLPIFCSHCRITDFRRQSRRPRAEHRSS